MEGEDVMKKCNVRYRLCGACTVNRFCEMYSLNDRYSDREANRSINECTHRGRINGMVKQGQIKAL